VEPVEPAGGRGLRYADALGPEHVGRRVVVRRRLAGGGLGDVLGTLLRFDELVVVRDRHGVEHAVARGDVVAGKPVPPAPARRGRTT